MIKWNDGIEAKAGEKLNKAMYRVISSKAVYVLFALTAFVVVSGAIEKFSP
jgi:hypothetical protein